jgi:tetratricopeptide (TPR) repeat protein
VIGTGALLGIAVALAALAWDPSAHAAEPKRVLGLLVAIVALAFAAARPRARVSRALSWSSWLGIGFVALSALSALWGRPAGRLDLATWLGAIACAAAAAQAGRASAIRTARAAAVVAGAAASVWALLSFGAAGRGFAIHAGQGNPNWLGLLLATTIPLSLETAVAEVTRRGLRDRRALAFVGLAALQPAALYASHSRVGWIAALVAIAWLGWSMRRVPKTLRAGAWTLALASVLTVAVIAGEHASRRGPAAVATSTTPRAAAHDDPTPEDAPAGRSLDGRLWIATHSLRAARDAAPFGTGLGGFGHAYLDAQGDALARLEVRAAARRFVNAGTAHDELLQVAVESGPLAALLLVAALIFALRDLRRSRWHAGGAVVIAFALCMLGDSPLRQPAPCAILALVMAASRRRLASRPAFGGARTLGSAAVLVLIAGMLLVSTRAWLATHFRDSPRLAMRIDPTSGDALLARGLEDLSLGRPDDALPRLERANQLVPAVAARVAIGEAHLASGIPAEARTALRTALAWHPGSLRARVAMAETERRLGDLGEAERHARAAHAVSPGDPRVAELESRIGEAWMDRD